MASASEKERISLERIVDTQKGKIAGISHDGYTVFRGIPYAKPPVGERRWKRPESTDPWEGVFRAGHVGNMCYQDIPAPDHPVMGHFYKEFYQNPDYLPKQSEDCLYLNIWSPDDADGNNPVAFWIHGGGFGGGCGNEIEFDGERYAAKKIILVTVNYRVGVFGFLAHRWLSEADSEGISGNYGIYDQIAALKWVYENIRAFGGNPDNITVFGQSAGSMSTQVLVSSPMTSGMISKAILQSGIACNGNLFPTPSQSEEEQYGKTFSSLADVHSFKELLAMKAEEIMEVKRKYDAKMWESGAGLTMVPNVDGKVLRKSVKEIWKEGTMHKIPYIAGCVSDDIGSVPGHGPGEILEECCRWAMKCEEVPGVPVYVYHFSHSLPGDDWGAFHSSELWYMFGTLGRCWRPMSAGDYCLSEKMVHFWTEFMKNGSPGKWETETWEPYTGTAPFIMDFQ